MKIAFQDRIEWDKSPHAERELGMRMRDVCISLGVDALYSSNKDQIERFAPDIVFPLHHYIPKLFDAYTIGCMWNPPDFFDYSYNTEVFGFENMKSYDAFAIASPVIENYLNTMCFRSPVKRDKYVIYPSTGRRSYEPVETFRKIAYVGSNWQGNRHRDLFMNCNKINVYGPRKSWEYLKDGVSKYCGELPFGNGAVDQTYRKNGIGLCFHSEQHLKDSVPNMRIFEMAAAGALVFADKLEFIEQNFGDSVIYIDTSKSDQEIIEQIDDNYYWVLSHEEKAREMAHRANEIFNEKFCLEKLFEDIFEKYSINKKNILPRGTNPSVEIIVRTDGKRETITKSISSIVDQSYKNISLTFAYWGENKLDFSKLLKRNIPVNFKYRILDIKDRHDRSYNLYYSIRNSFSDYIGFCDDDDLLFNNHVERLVEILEKNKKYDIAYSGAIMKETIGKSVKRELAYYHDFHNFETTSYITSNSYLLRRKSLPDNVMTYEIPNLNATEDRILLECLYSSGCKFIFSDSVTCLFTRNKKRGKNASSDKELWANAMTYYYGFSRKSSKFMEYIDEDEPKKKVLKGYVPGRTSRFIKILKFLLRKLVPHRLRKYILLMIKELVSSSSNV